MPDIALVKSNVPHGMGWKACTQEELIFLWLFLRKNFRKNNHLRSNPPIIVRLQAKVMII
jgi:hypothetical protein